MVSVCFVCITCAYFCIHILNFAFGRAVYNLTTSKMEYIRPKLQINRYKKKPPHILFQKIAQEINHETQAKLNFSLDYDLSLWLIQLLSLNPQYGIGYRRLFDQTAVNALIKDYLQIISGNFNILHV